MPVAGLLEEAVEIPSGVQLKVDGDFVVVTGGGHTLRRRLSHPRLRIDVKGQQATIRCEFPRRKEAALVGTFAAHLRNMVVGVNEGFTYEMKIVYSHFPLKATVKGSEFIIGKMRKNNFGRLKNNDWVRESGSFPGNSTSLAGKPMDHYLAQLARLKAGPQSPPMSPRVRKLSNSSKLG